MGSSGAEDASVPLTSSPCTAQPTWCPRCVTPVGPVLLGTDLPGHPWFCSSGVFHIQPHSCHSQKSLPCTDYPTITVIRGPALRALEEAITRLTSHCDGRRAEREPGSHQYRPRSFLHLACGAPSTPGQPSSSAPPRWGLGVLPSRTPAWTAPHSPLNSLDLRSPAGLLQRWGLSRILAVWRGGPGPPAI